MPGTNDGQGQAFPAFTSAVLTERLFPEPQAKASGSTKADGAELFYNSAAWWLVRWRACAAWLFPTAPSSSPVITYARGLGWTMTTSRVAQKKQRPLQTPLFFLL